MASPRTIALVLRSFPAAWRKEYGQELAALLERRPLTLGILGDVLRAGLLQRSRRVPLWAKGAGVLALWFMVGLVANSLYPMSLKVYGRYQESCLLLQLLLGFVLVRSGKGSPGKWTACATALASMPMLGIEVLRSTGWVHPTVLDLQGHVSQQGHGFVEFAYRGDPARPELLPVLLVVVCSAAAGRVLGWLGGQVALAVQAFHEGRAARI